MPENRTPYTRENLAHALTVSRNLSDMVLALGLEDSVYRRKYVAKKLRDFAPDHRHLLRTYQRYTPDLLAEAAAHSQTVKQVVRYLNVRESGGTEAHIARQLRKFRIDTSHFLGQAHNRGKKRGPRRSAHQVLVKNPDESGRTRGNVLRRALTENGVESRCVECGTGATWRGKEMTLEIDHINGDLTDNRRENLRYLCPNCHAITDTYCRRKRAEMA